MKATRTVIGPCRLSYAKVINPDPETKKYSCVLLIPKADVASMNHLKEAVEAAKMEAVQKGVKNAKNFRAPIHDGDGERPRGGEYGPECKGMWVLNVSSMNKPGIVDKHLNEIIDPTEIYSGMWAKVDINAYSFTYQGNSGISLGLNNIQKIKDDDPLGGGKPNAKDAFSVEDDDDGIL